MAALRAIALCLLCAACAKERPVLRLLPEASRVSKPDLEGTFVLLKSVVSLFSPGPEYQGLAPGVHLESGKLVQFVQSENQVDVVSIDPLFETQNAAVKSRRSFVASRRTILI